MDTGGRSAYKCGRVLTGYCPAPVSISRRLIEPYLTDKFDRHHGARRLPTAAKLPDGLVHFAQWHARRAWDAADTPQKNELLAIALLRPVVVHRGERRRGVWMLGERLEVDWRPRINGFLSSAVEAARADAGKRLSWGRAVPGKVYPPRQLSFTALLS